VHLCEDSGKTYTNDECRNGGAAVDYQPYQRICTPSVSSRAIVRAPPRSSLDDAKEASRRESGNTQSHFSRIMCSGLRRKSSTEMLGEAAISSRIALSRPWSTEDTRNAMPSFDVASPLAVNRRERASFAQSPRQVRIRMLCPSTNQCFSPRPPDWK